MSAAQQEHSSAANQSLPARASVGRGSLAWIAASVVAVTIAHAAGALFGLDAGAAVWAHEPLHALAESTGAVIGLAVAVAVLLTHKLGFAPGRSIPLAYGLITMSVLDLLHAASHVGEQFVWLHTLATIGGGAMFAIVLLPDRVVTRRNWPGFVCCALVVFGVATTLVPSWAPSMLNDGQFTSTAVALNLCGGALFLVAAMRLFMLYRTTGVEDDLLFAVHSASFGGAAVMFRQSTLWNFEWWWWHGLRFAAYFLAAGFAILTVRRMVGALHRHRQDLQSAYDDAFQQASENHRMLEGLRNALDEHALFSMTNTQGKITDVNEGFCKLSGYSRDELIGQDHRVINSGYHPRQFFAEIWQTITSGQPWRGEICNQAKDGTLYWVDSTIIPQFSADGAISGYTSLRFDITSRKQMQAKLRKAQLELAEQQDRFTRAINGSTDGLWDRDLISGTEWYSDQFKALLGYSEDTFEQLEPSTEAWSDLLHPADRERVLQHADDAIAGKCRYDIEYRLRTTYGTYRWFRARGSRLADDNGRATRFSGSLTDIHELKLIQAELESRNKSLVDARERLELAIDGTNDGIWDWRDVQDDAEWWSPRFYSLLGYADGEIPSTLSTFKSLLHPDDVQPTLDAVKVAFDGGAPFDVTYRLRTKTGEYRWFRGRAKVFHDEGGDPRRMAGSLCDVHDLREAEAQLEVLNRDLLAKNEELERFVYSASHDLKSPIVTIVGFASLVKNELGSGDIGELVNHINRIERAAMRMRQHVDDLLELSRVGRERNDPKVVDLAVEFDAVIENHEVEIARQNAIVLCELETSELVCDPAHIRQILNNLVGNALKYGCSNDSSRIVVGARPSERGLTEIFVDDEGPGVDERHATRIFDLFQKLDKSGTGTGVGLAIVARIAQHYGGRAWVESNIAGGASFRVTLGCPMNESDVICAQDGALR